MNKAIPVIIGLGLVGSLALVLLVRKARSATTPEVVETGETVDVSKMLQKIQQAASVAELNAYYNLAGELFITEQISYMDYKNLYDVYQARWYELTGVAE